MIPHSAVFLGEEEVEATARVLRSGRLSQGPEVEAFEEECAAFVGRAHAVAVNSGTSALHLALGAVGVSEGDRVAAPSYACASIITAIGMQGGRPELCDSGLDHCLDPAWAPEDIPMVFVHLFGMRGRVPTRARVIEDVAQSMGGPTGASTEVAVTSFYATKLMTTGEGGMVLTDDEGIAEAIRDRRDYDNREDFRPRANYKMTEMQAAIGRVQLERLPEFVARRREIAEHYSRAFAGLPMECPGGEGHAYFRYVVGLEQRDELERYLAACGVEAKRPVHRPAHHYLGGEFPGAERAHRRLVSIPIYPALREEEREHVIESVLGFFSGDPPHDLQGT